MKLLITGGTGYIGSGIARAAAEAGHQVVALAHHGKAKRELEERGYATVPGDLRDPASFARALAEVDGVIHAANTGGEDAARVDEMATRAMVQALEGSGNAFVYTSGVWVLGSTGDEQADESSPPAPAELVAWRADLERWVLDAAGRAVRSMVVRPGIVYGRGGGIPGMMARGELPLVGDGSQRWPMVHVDDLAELYVLAVERGPAGSVLHAVAHEVMASEVAAARAPEEVERLDLKEARRALGAFADALSLDQRVSAAETQALLGWSPKRAAPVASGAAPIQAL